MAIRQEIRNNDPTDYQTINFNPLNFRTTFNVCSFQDKLNFANTGLSAAYKELFQPVSKISSSTEPYGEIVEGYLASDPERGSVGNVYNSKEPKYYSNWFSYLNPYNPTTKTYTIDSKFVEETLRIQEKYYPNGVEPLHIAFDSFFDQFGGSRSLSITPVIDIDPTIPPFMNVYFHAKKISNEIKNKTGLNLTETKLPVGMKDLKKEKQQLKIGSKSSLTMVI